MAKSSGAGSQIVMLLILLGILGGAGTWNYRRNLAIENAEPRPYRSFSSEDLESLRSAYQAEVDVYTQRFRQASSKSVRVRDGGMLREQVDEFERVQKLSVGKRDIASQYAKHQVQLDAVDAEIARRATVGGEWQERLRLATTLP
jgi:hypothetical protein